MQLYDAHPEYAKNNAAFMREIVSAYPQLKFFQPSPQKAPWHVQVVIDSDTGREGEINFWPHKLKVSYHGPSEVGLDAMHRKINEALNDVLASAHGEFDVSE